MPEYLAPGVYVEEIDTGSKPIEGVSTSTAGMIGVTERGPLHVPLLITSYGEFTRWFGERLNSLLFTNANGPHCYLPQAVEGFFLNGGKRVYITRVLDDAGAANAGFDLHDRGTPGGADTIILRPAARNTGTAANLPLLVVFPDTNLANNDNIRIGEGSSAEYRRVTAAPVVDTVAVPLSLPLSSPHAGTAPVPIGQFTPAPPVRVFQLVVTLPPTQTTRGEQTIEITGTEANLTALIGAADPRLLEVVDLGRPNRREHRIVRRITRLSSTNATVMLDSPLSLSYANTSDVNQLNVPAPGITATLPTGARANDSLLFVGSRGTDFDLRADMVLIQQAGSEEVRRIGELRRLTLVVPLPQPYPAATVVEGVELTDDDHITMNVAIAGAGTALSPITLTTPAHAAELSAGLTLLLGTGATQELVEIQSVNVVANQIVLTVPLVSAKGAGDPVVPIRFLNANSRAGAGFVALNNRQGLAVGRILRIGAANDEEFVTITQLPNHATAGADPGTVIFTPPLARAYAQGTTQVVQQNEVVLRDVSPSALVLEAAAAAGTLLISDGGGGAGSHTAGSLISLATAGGAVTYHRVSAISAAPEVPQMVTIDRPLRRDHRPGAPLVERQPLVTVVALDPGAWGDRLRISVSDEAAGLVNNTRLDQFGPPTLIRLASAAGVEEGTILEFVDANGVVQGEPRKVDAINLATGDITLAAPGLLPAQQALGLTVRFTASSA